MVEYELPYFKVGGILMAICYDKLWKLLIDKDMKKKDLEQAAGNEPYRIERSIRNKL